MLYSERPDFVVRLMDQNSMKEWQLRADLEQEKKKTTTADTQTLLQAALTAYQNARIDGLCHEGAYEIALQTIPHPHKT